MTAIFKKNLSPDNKCAKIFGTETKSVEIYFIDTANVTSPQVDLVADLAEISKFNYCDIAALGRKYFIRDITTLDGERARVSLRVDVLASFYDDVLSARVLANRSTDKINVLVPDNNLRNSVRGIPQIKTFTGGEWLPTITTGVNGIVITTFGGGVANGT